MNSEWRGNETEGSNDLSELLLRARAGSSDAIGQILQLFRTVLLRAAKRHIPVDIRPKESPSDEVQQTFLEAYRDFPQFSGVSKGDLLGWLSGILRNNCRDIVSAYRDRSKRDIAREVPLDEASTSNKWQRPSDVVDRSPARRMVAREQSTVLVRAMERLPENQRHILQLRFAEHLTFKEIADRVGSSAEAVRKMLTRALQQLHTDSRLQG
jgi:RNA polymerase sigma-70 factor (ECF subfamily)